MVTNIRDLVTPRGIRRLFLLVLALARPKKPVIRLSRRSSRKNKDKINMASSSTAVRAMVHTKARQQDDKHELQRLADGRRFAIVKTDLGARRAGAARFSEPLGFELDLASNQQQKLPLQERHVTAEELRRTEPGRCGQQQLARILELQRRRQHRRPQQQLLRRHQRREHRVPDSAFLQQKKTAIAKSGSATAFFRGRRRRIEVTAWPCGGSRQSLTGRGSTNRYTFSRADGSLAGLRRPATSPGTPGTSPDVRFPHRSSAHRLSHDSSSGVPWTVRVSVPDSARPASEHGASRSSFVAVTSHPNLGKISTLVNALCSSKVTMVSDKPQTTERRTCSGCRERRGPPDRARRPAQLPERHATRLTERIQRTMDSSFEDVEADASSCLPPASGRRQRPASSPRTSSRSASRSSSPWTRSTAWSRAAFRSRWNAGGADAAGFSALDPMMTKTSNGIRNLRDELVGLLSDRPVYFQKEPRHPDLHEKLQIAELIREKALWLDPTTSAAKAAGRGGRNDRLRWLTHRCWWRPNGGIRSSSARAAPMVEEIGTRARQEVDWLFGDGTSS